ncbi:polysaccharide biosynthesis/export family protein [Flavobacterium cerinum]|uniref:Polysaccharide biosynthesis/export family protein n=1 Tax=Flavobacterium cerinum TaxID=2502784 RepID=A0ABY5IW07_9FLAO|nr:polysaccharide biosynthesis/export family protein [Flavobacterium cerinum]UUC47011.1 polysaccharide biosynthesis/export family protein [Flavobacterium cerinum]
MGKAFLMVLLIGILSVSCVPNKDLLYLQNYSKDTLAVAVSPVLAKPYRIQTNDVLSIKIKALDQKLVDMFNPMAASGSTPVSETDQSLYFNGFSVNDHGNIRIPVLGEVNVLGYTLDEVRVSIEKQLLQEYFRKEANIFVDVRLAGFRYTINGEINTPGTKTLYQDRVTIMQAIANSGDITITGNRKEVVVIRQYPHGTEMHTINLTDAKAMKSPYYYIQPNDYIYVKPLKQKSWGTGTTGMQTVATVISAMSLVTTALLLFKNL